MRLSLLLVALLGIVLGACTPPTPQIIKGKIFQSVSSGGKALAGAKVSISAGSDSKSATTGSDGSFSIEMSSKPATFSITSEPPSTSFASVSYDGLPFEAYASGFGAASELNIYLPGGTAASNPGFPARFGCVGGTLTDGGNPVVSTPAAISTPPSRTSPSSCDGSVPTNLLVSASGLRPGENGLVIFGGLRAVYTKAGGNYLIPVVTTNNGWASSGSLWAGNYTGTDTGNPATAFEYFWDKFVYLPQTEALLNGSTQTHNLQLEAFNPSTNSSKVTTLKVSHDTTALTGFNFADPDQAFSYSIPSFEHAITSSAIELGRYFDFSAGPRNLRVPKLQSGKQGQQISVSNVALNLVSGAESSATFWRDGTSLSNEVKADFLGIASPQTPTHNSTAVNRKPNLSWKAVAKAKLYEVIILDGNKLVWYGVTEKNSLAVPITLQANKKYSWGLIAFDQRTLTDWIGREPFTLPASVGFNLEPKWTRPDNPLHHYYQQLIQQYTAAGYTPNLDFGGTNLKATGYRESYSELFSFTTGQ